MEYKTPQPLITLSVIFIIAAVAVGYYLDKPLFNKFNELKQEVIRLSNSKKLKTDYENEIRAINQELTEIDWNSKKDKITINFESSPFFISKAEIFFKDVSLKSGLAFTSVTFSQPVAVKAVTQQQTQASGETKSSKDFKPQDETGATPQQSSGPFAGISGPVNKTTFTLSVSGSYNALKLLLQSMEKQALLISIKSITFNAIDDGKGSYTIGGDIYSY